MTSIVPFISNAIFEASDIELMSDAYDRAMEDVHGFGRPNRIVKNMIATRIIVLTHSGERDPKKLRERALAACGFNPAKHGHQGT
ncbi:MAG: hypothetical protein WAM99_24555 [Xanthobacteraceae bacterium]|jgi:hypothetical protein